MPVVKCISLHRCEAWLLLGVEHEVGTHLAVSQREPVDAGSCLGLTEKVIQQLGRWFLLSFLFLLTLLFFRLRTFLAAAVTGP